MIFTKKNRILIIENDDEDTFILSKLLTEQNQNYAIKICDTMASAQAILSTENYDIVLLDLNLTDSHGIESLKAVLATGHKGIVIILTGHDDDKTAQEAISMGAQDYLVKGKFKADHLNRYITNAQERKRFSQELARLASIPEQSPHPLIEITGAEITYLNPAASQLFNTDQNKMTHPIFDGIEFIKKQFHHSPQKEIERVIQLGSHQYEQRFLYLKENNIIRCTLFDITEKMALEKMKSETMASIIKELSELNSQMAQKPVLNNDFFEKISLQLNECLGKLKNILGSDKKNDH